MKKGGGVSLKIFQFKDVLPQIPNLVFLRKLKFRFELLPYEVRDIRYKKIVNFFAAGLNQFFLPASPLGRPVIAQVEPANFCNLSCPLCLTTSETGSRPKALLPFNTFKKFIDEAGDYLLLIVLWNWGEPFLNPDIFRMIAYAKSRNIVVHSSTNGNLKFSEEKAEKLIGSGLDSLVVAVDGATQETYSRYRRGGDLEQVISNIRTIVRTKRKMNSPTPRLNLRFVVMKHNENELPLVRKLAEELNVDFFTLKTVDMPPALGEKLDSIYQPGDQKYRRYEYVTGTYKRKEKPFLCMRPWKRITLDALGEIIMCEYEHKDILSFGNLNDGKSAISVWKGDRAGDVRRKFNLGYNDFYLCKNCTYKNRVDNDCSIEMTRLREERSLQ